MKTWIRSILSMLTVLLLSCGGNNESGEKEKKEENSTSVVLTDVQMRNAGIVVGKAERRTVNAVIKVNGVVEVNPQSSVSVSFPLGGYIKSSRMLPGMYVKKGDVLAALEDQQYIQLQQDYLVAKLKLATLDAEFVRQKALNASQAASDRVFQQIFADYQIQKILVKGLSEKLELIGINPANLNESNLSRSINLTSPINGYVAKVNVSIGRYVSATDVFFELVNPADIYLALTVFEKDLPSLRAGQSVTAFSNENPGKKYGAKVILITKSLDENHAGEVHCHFAAHDRSLLPGMYMTAEIQSPNAEVISLPEDAIVRWQNVHYIFISQTTGRFDMRQVEIGQTDNGYTEIKTGNPQEFFNLNIVTHNAYALLMKMKNSGEEE